MTVYKSPNLDVQSLIISTRKTKKGLMKTNVYKDNEKSFSPLTAPLHDYGRRRSQYKTFDNKSQSIK